MAKEFEVCRAGFVFIVQLNIYERNPTPIQADEVTNCSSLAELLLPKEHSRAHLEIRRRIGASAAEVVYRCFRPALEMLKVWRQDFGPPYSRRTASNPRTVWRISPT
jgi:hypothetical protein